MRTPLRVLLFIASAVVAAGALAACGGGEEQPNTTADEFARQMEELVPEPSPADTPKSFDELSRVEQRAIELAESELGGTGTAIGFVRFHRNPADCGGRKRTYCAEWEVDLNNDKQARCIVYSSFGDYDGYCIRS